MRPETNIRTIIADVCSASGHWPYTADARVFIGFRPGQERLQTAGDRAFVTEIEYDVVICARRGPGAADAMETMRYRLYSAMREGGWRLAGDPGPESYDRAQEIFMWPATFARRFYADAAGLPEEITVIREGANDEDA